MSYCMVQDEKSVVGVWWKSYICAKAAPYVCADLHCFHWHTIVDPLLVCLSLSANSDVICCMMDFDFNSVDGYVLMHACFKSYCIAIRVEFGDCFDCTSVVLFSYIKVDVAAHAAFWKAVVLCYALAFEED